MSKLLEIDSLESGFDTEDGLVRAVDGVSFELEKGRTLGIVGESGCGKTTLAKIILGLLPQTSGSVHLSGQPLPQIPRLKLARMIQPVFQDPYSSLNPRFKVKDIIGEPLKFLQKNITKNDLNKSVFDAVNNINDKISTVLVNKCSTHQKEIDKILGNIKEGSLVPEPILSFDVHFFNGFIRKDIPGCFYSCDMCVIVQNFEHYRTMKIILRVFMKNELC